LTVTAGPREITSACTGALLEFPCPNFARPTDVQVYLLDGPGAANEDGTLLVDGDDYTISGSGEDGSAKIETAVAYPFGQWIRAFRVSEGAQVAEYEVNQGFPAAATEYELDRLTLRDAELSGDTSDVENRALRVPRGETAAVLPGPDDRKGSLLGFSLFTGVRELLTYANVSALLAPFLTPLLAAINKGDPGGNIMAIGLFLAGGTLNIPVGTNIVRTSGYSADGKGGAFYQYDAAVDAAYVAAHPRSAFVSANGRGFRLSLDQQINVCMFGAVGDDAANDGAAFVAALAFCFANFAGGNRASAMPVRRCSRRSAAFTSARRRSTSPTRSTSSAPAEAPAARRRSCAGTTRRPASASRTATPRATPEPARRPIRAAADRSSGACT
jgi:hypothetical protein